MVLKEFLDFTRRVEAGNAVESFDQKVEEMFLGGMTKIRTRDQQTYNVRLESMQR